MKIQAPALIALLLGGCVSTPPAPVTRTIYVPADTQTVVVVKEAPAVYYPGPVWGIRFGLGFGHRRPGPWRH